jgi:hypothetical protein
MNISFEDQIRERAYHLWLAGGMADGMAHEHWLSAEQAVLGQPVASSEADEPVVILTEAASKPRTAAAPKGKAKSTAPKASRSRKAMAAAH